MAQHERFHYTTREALEEDIHRLGVALPLADDLGPLAGPVKVGPRTAPNAFAVLPMEGCDSEADGSPSELVARRYKRFAAGGAGLLWWEACAVVPEGRANPLQMMMTRENVGAFERLRKTADRAAKEANGAGHKPVNILQLTHSGRYSRPVAKPAPIVPVHDPLLDKRVGIDESWPLVTDDYLDGLVEHYVESALLAKEAGFDGVDIKACHRYLLSELLSAHTREGRYGGSYENRVSLLLNTIREVKRAVDDDFIVASRFNVFDAHPAPYGFGQGADGGHMSFDAAEPMRLVRDLCAAGAGLLSNSAGNPYYLFPQVTRPFDRSSTGIPVPEEHPLESVERLFRFTAEIQAAAGEVPVVGNGYTWLRQWLPYAGAANLAAGRCRFVGLGRSSFAYPDAPRDVLAGRGMDPGKVCIACSKCTQIMRDWGRTGCPVRDSEVYMPLYKEAREAALAKEAAK